LVSRESGFRRLRPSARLARFDQGHVSVFAIGVDVEETGQEAYNVVAFASTARPLRETQGRLAEAPPRFVLLNVQPRVELQRCIHRKALAKVTPIEAEYLDCICRGPLRNLLGSRN
jgi:hypothetical protein